MEVAQVIRREPVEARFVESRDYGLLVISPKAGTAGRRILFTNISGGAEAWERLKAGLLPSNRFWGCWELLRMGYEIGIAEPLPDFYFRHKPIPHDLRYWKAARSWLRRDDILYCAHNVMYWLPLLKMLSGLKCHVVSLLYAKEPLAHSGAHSGIIALNPAAASHARALAPKAKVAHLGWGMDLQFYQPQPYDPHWFLSCGRTRRDDKTLHAAACHTKQPIRVIAHSKDQPLNWPANVEIVAGGDDWESRLSYAALFEQHYTPAAASLVVVRRDDIDYTACGFTGMLEAMALARPVIATKTGAVRGELDLDKTGCGLSIPPGDPDALVEALDRMAAEPEHAEAMGRAGRNLVQSHYNMDRFARDLHEFFNGL